ncbi:HNH endonuclease signature motif containing protein [Dokdonia sp.]|uniref:HNH endonuclease n=1 Tax=Dokdonia sp. TaxID=2024995 RepID=UPI003264D23A
MKIKERIFHSWLIKTQPQIGNPGKYSKTITTLSNHLKKQNISSTDLFSIDSYSETENLKELYFANNELYEKNVRGNRMYSRAFDLYLEFLKDNYESESISDDIINTTNRKGITETERKNYVLSRIGQGFYRKQLIDYWKSCSVTAIKEVPLLIASHIKPWKKSNDFEKLDVYNGLLLTPNLDKVFDLGLISFDNEGKIIISEFLDDYVSFGIKKNMIVKIALEHKPYLEYHRKNILKTK